VYLAPHGEVALVVVGWLCHYPRTKGKLKTEGRTWAPCRLPLLLLSLSGGSCCCCPLLSKNNAQQNKRGKGCTWRPTVRSLSSLLGGCCRSSWSKNEKGGGALPCRSHRRRVALSLSKNKREAKKKRGGVHLGPTAIATALVGWFLLLPLITVQEQCTAKTRGKGCTWHPTARLLSSFLGGSVVIQE
jgi:hypothetical protein